MKTLFRQICSFIRGRHGAGAFVLLLLVLLFFSVRCHGQVVTSNPMELVELGVGNGLINDWVKKQTTNQEETAVLENSIAAEFTMIHDWQNKYNSYLKSVDGYASSLKACSHIYNDGVKILLTLSQLASALKDNPQGVVATISMNNLYLEVASEALTVYTLIRDAVAQGGSENMLTGAERSKTLWAINDELVEFYKKLRSLYVSVKYYKLTDVWYNMTQGMLDRDNGEIARSALSRWKRAAQIVK